MTDMLTVDEINERFPSEWVLLSEPQTDEHLKVLGGAVVCHSKDEEEVHRKAMEMPAPKRIAVFYTGPFPEDEVFVL